MVFYSISDVTDKLLATSGSLAPTLQENFWVSNIQLEHTDPLWEVLEDLSPSAMAAFDLACTQCRLWKTCKQLLETAERKLYSSLETRGRLLSCRKSLYMNWCLYSHQCYSNVNNMKLDHFLLFFIPNLYFVLFVQ